MNVTRTWLPSRQEESFEELPALSIRYVLCLNGIVTGPESLVAARQHAERIKQGGPPALQYVEAIRANRSDVLPDVEGAISVLLIL